MITILAWAIAAVSFLVFLVALSVDASCSNTVGQWSAGAFFFSWAWLTYRHDRRDRR